MSFINDQSLNGGLIQEFLPGNIINANLLGYTTMFSSNTPVSQVAYSLARFQQDNTPRYPGDVVQVLPGENGQNPTETQADKDFYQRLKDLLNTPTGELFGMYPKGTSTQAAPATDTKQHSAACANLQDTWLPFQSICDSTVEGSKRFGLVIAGLLLLALGIWALK